MASMFGKTINFYDNEKIIRTFQTLQCPTQIKFAESSSESSDILLITERNQLSVWDLRSPVACTKRISVCI